MKVVIFTKLLTMLILLGFSSAFASTPHGDPQTAANVDLTKFLGKWYEIAAIPYFFERDCAGTNANYSLRPDGKIDVLNTCHDKTLTGPIKTGHGYAELASKSDNAKLKVTFFPPFFAKYWIHAVGANYEYAVTANPIREYLLILSRTPTMDAATYQGLLKNAQAQGFDISKLVKTAQ